MAVALQSIAFGVIVSSDLARARQTAQAVAKTKPLVRHVEDARLREIDIPAWTGLTKREIDRRFPGERALWKGSPPHPPEGAESWHDFETRVRSALDYLASQSTQSLVVAHAGVLRVLRITFDWPHAKLSRSHGVWLEQRDDRLHVGDLQRLDASLA